MLRHRRLLRIGCPRGRAILSLVLFVLGVAAIAAVAEDLGPPRIEAANLTPALAGAGGTMLELTGPEPGPAERWRRGLAAAIERRDQAIAELQAQLAQAAGDDRVRLERRLQARKLDFEIEVLELQLGFGAERPEQADPESAEARAEAVARLEASLEAARTLREGVAAGEEAR